jgi:HD superfamily phosphohydrolase
MAEHGEQEQLIGVDGSKPVDVAARAESPANVQAVTPGDVLAPLATDDEADKTALVHETLLPVSGMVRVSRRELDVIDHPAFQRLFEIYQLGQTHLVYRGATHTRGEHAIGTLEQATRLADAVCRNAPEPGAVSRSETWQRAEGLSEVERAFVRLAALLHDIGHIAAGHTLEDELGLLSQHDADERIEMILDRTEWHGRNFASLRNLIDERYADEAAIAAQRDDDGTLLSASQVVQRLISRDQEQAGSTPGTDFRVQVCRDLVGNTICADLLDYLQRDFLHLGKPLLFDPRLLEYIEVRTRTVGGERQDRLAINLRGTPRPRPDAVTAILSLLESRYQLAEIALFHRVKNAASGMFERAIAEYRDTFDADGQAEAIAELTPELLECSDVEMLRLFEQRLSERRPAGETERVEGAIELLRRLRVRELHRELHTLFLDDVGRPERARLIVERFCCAPDLEDEAARIALRDAANRRLATLRTLEQDFGLAPASIVMYCPPLQMNTKLAEVGIYLGGVVDSLLNLDRENPNLTGGHLDAQQRRFSRLWRISFAIDSHAYDELRRSRLLEPLRETIERVVLATPGSGRTSVDEAVRSIAEDLVRLEGSPWHGRPILEPALNREQPSVEYPGGAPSIRSFIGGRNNKRRRLTASS